MKILINKSKNGNTNIRYNILSAFTYLVGIIILIRLFDLQIINGDEYRETSNTRLSREASIEAVRGSILDRNGNVLVSTEMTFKLEMYKSKIDDENLNSSILAMTTILENNGDSYVDTFPIKLEPFEFTFDSEEELDKWKEKYKISDEASAEEAFYIFKDKYNIKYEDIYDIRKVIRVRYAIATIGYSNTKSIEISENISRVSVLQIQENSQSITGTNIIVEPVRKYHTGTLASHIIGYVSRIRKENLEEFDSLGDTHEYDTDDKVGQTGVEKTFETYLRGEDGIKQIDMAVDGTVTGEYVSKEAVGGANITLTIDSKLQQIAEDSLENNILKIREGGFGEQIEAEGGAVVVINVNSGEILAMASYPDYDPNDFFNGISQSKLDEYNNNPYHPLYSKAFQSTYAPGSTYKMVTAIAALESGNTTTTERINDNGPYYGITDSWVKAPACWYYNDYGRGHGYLNVSGAIQKSCNYFFYEVGIRTGIDTINKYAKYFGLGSKTGIEIAGESKGVLASKEVASSQNQVWSSAQTAYAAIGQGYNSFTPLQMAKYTAMVANGGNAINVSIIKDITLSDGTEVSRGEIEEFVNEKYGILNQENIQISEETMNAVLEGMRSVTEGEGGTAYSIFKDFSISVGGKTGSAETSNKNKTNAWFVGFAPFDNPEIAVVVMVENGKHGYYTAEVVKEIVYEYFGMNVNNEEIVEEIEENIEGENWQEE